MPDSAPEPGITPPTTPAKRGHAGLLLTAVAAVALILGSDHALRAREDLVTNIAAHDVPIFLPCSDFLGDHVEKKTNWNHLYYRLAADRATHNVEDFVKASYELSTFVRNELSIDDARRRQVLLDVIDLAGRKPAGASPYWDAMLAKVSADPSGKAVGAEQAYWDLFLPEWKQTLQPSYVDYTTALAALAKAQGKLGVSTLQQLAAQLQQVNEPALELQALRALRSASPVTVTTEEPMRRLLSVLGPGDPDRAPLEADLAAFQRRREQLTASMNWYAGFLAKAGSADLSTLVKLRATAPAGAVDPFIASADARLVERYLQAGRIADADKLREAMAGHDLGDIDESSALAVQQAGGTPTASAKTPSPTMPLPDAAGILLCQWRGKLLAGQFADADAIANLLFFSDSKALKKFADDERSFMAGQTTRLTPQLVLQPRSTDLPPELAGAGSALFGQFPLKPIGKVAPASVHSSADLWLTDDKVLVVFTADEPRPDAPAPKMKTRDQDVWKDECVELFFNPDRWFDLYYQLDVNPIGTVFDARNYNMGTFARRQFKVDRTLNLNLTATPTKTATGWELRLVFPRTEVFPPGGSAIKFNIRRVRYVMEKGQLLPQYYSWTPNGGGPEHRPEQFGWVILPK